MPIFAAATFEEFVVAVVLLCLTAIFPRFKQFVNDYQNGYSPVHHQRLNLPLSKPRKPLTKAEKVFWVKTAMQIVISAVFLVLSIQMIFKQGASETDKHWAFATFGTILGFWLRH